MPSRICTTRIQSWMTGGLLLLMFMQLGCARLRLPAIDPAGRNLFLPAPNSTGILTSANRGQGINPGFVNPGAGFNPLRTAQANPLFQPPSFPAPQSAAPRFPVQPAFQVPPTPPPCDGSAVRTRSKKHLIPNPIGQKTPGQNGQIIMTPSRIVAPVGSEVVVLAGVCGGDGFFVKNQPLEWMLSNNSVGELIEVGGNHHPTFNRLIPPTSKKFSGQYAWGRTGLKNVVLSRGTPTPVDDIELREGQTFVSVSSSSPGTSYVTAVAPKAEGWDKRRGSTTIHWVDGLWSIPVPARATAGTVYPLTTVVNRTDGGGLKDWDVRYTIVGGAPAEFAPAGSQKADATTDSDGKATVQIRQPAGQFDTGTTQVRVDVIRPPVYGEPELVVESGITAVTWSAPALTLRAVGPKTVDANTPFTYRVEVSNPGDQVARDVVVRTKNLDDAIEFISSNPKPTEYGRDYEWKIGNIAPGSETRYVDIQLKSQKRGNVGMCFEVASATDQLFTEACTETEIILPCVGFDIDGPTTARQGAEIPFNINIENQCDEPLENIVVKLTHDPGLVRLGQPNPKFYSLPLLQFGESRPLPVSFTAQGTGTQCFSIEITGDNFKPRVGRHCIEISPGQGGIGGGLNQPGTGGIGNGQSDNGQPSPAGSPLAIRVSQPAATDVGRGASVSVDVTNRGAEAIDGVTLTNRFPASLDAIQLTRTLDHRWVDDELFVNLGRIEPGQTVPIRILYEGVQVDPNAVSEFSVSAPRATTATGTTRIQVNPQGTGTGISIQAPDQPNVPDFGGGQQNGGGIGIPDDNANLPRDQPAGGNLAVRAQTIDPTIRVGEESRMEIVVTNNSNAPLRDVVVELLVPNTVELVDWDYTQNNLELVSNNGNRFYQVEKALVLRPGDTLRWVAFFEGLAPGQATVEIRANSPDIVGASSGADSISVGQ